MKYFQLFIALIALLAAGCQKLDDKFLAVINELESGERYYLYNDYKDIESNSFIKQGEISEGFIKCFSGGIIERFPNHASGYNILLIESKRQRHYFKLRIDKGVIFTATLLIEFDGKRFKEVAELNRVNCSLSLLDAD